MIIDMDQSCLYGMIVLYDKSIPLSDVKAAIEWTLWEMGLALK